jgi:hypothetical protein
MNSKKEHFELTLQYCQQVEAFQEILLSAFDAGSQLDSRTLKEMIGELRSLFREHLWLKDEDLAESSAHRVQAVLVEIDKQLRLLEMDAAFLQAARQSVTQEQRRQQIFDRLQLLIRYCDMLNQ